MALVGAPPIERCASAWSFASEPWFDDHGAVQRRAVAAVKSFVADQDAEENFVYLLSDSNQNRISGDSLGNYIRKYTLDDMTESDYNKISVSRVKSMDDFALLQKISEFRGTSVQTLITEYNVNLKLDAT